MGLLDAPLRKVAKTVTAKLGTSVTVRTKTAAAYNVTTRTMTPTTSDVTIKGRIDNYTERELSDTVHAADRKLTIAAADVTTQPTVDDVVVIAAVEHDVIAVRPELATDLAAIYVLQLRR